MKKTVICILIILVAAIGAGAVYYVSNSDAENDFFAMDTYVSTKIHGFGAPDVSEKIEETVHTLESSVLSRQEKDSYVSKLNKNHGGKLSGNMDSYLETMLGIAEKSGGKFDFTLGALSDLWGFGDKPAVPDAEKIKKTLALCGTDKIELEKNSVSFPKGMILDFGSVGKGIALDEISSELGASKIKEAVISVGGSILLYGEREFTVGITDPAAENGYMAVLTLPECCVSTSGNYERFFEEDGKRYHHILDPETGYPVDNGVVSVTVVSKSGIISDALSTACFALGINEGRKLAESYGCDTVFIDSENNVYVSDGIKDRIELTADGFTLKDYEG
jgi:thiamine biosynthesis lipoprotein